MLFPSLQRKEERRPLHSILAASEGYEKEDDHLSPSLPLTSEAVPTTSGQREIFTKEGEGEGSYLGPSLSHWDGEEGGVVPGPKGREGRIRKKGLLCSDALFFCGITCVGSGGRAGVKRSSDTFRLHAREV